MITPLAVDLKTAASMCGYSVKTMRRAIKKGDIAAIGATAKIVVLVDDLRDYLERHKLSTSVAKSTSSKPVNKKVARTKLDSGGHQWTESRRQ